MVTPKTKSKPDDSTELKIKIAARNVFHKKGFAAARTRDIAEEAGINLALLNYYFRSKEKLFDLIMIETLQTFIQSVAKVFNDEGSTLDEKVTILADKYIDLLLEEPEIPIFLLNELRSHPNTLLKKFNLKKVVANSVLLRQWQQSMKENKLPAMHPLHFMVNLIALVVFPFIGSPMLRSIGSMNDEQFRKMMLERKTLIPIWIKAMLKAK
jgi:AcrR family transcriptional regulator